MAFKSVLNRYSKTTLAKKHNPFMIRIFLTTGGKMESPDGRKLLIRKKFGLLNETYQAVKNKKHLLNAFNRCSFLFHFDGLT